METYLVNQLVGESFKVENVASTWTCERGVHFNDESDKEIAFAPYSNLTNYQLYLQPIEAKSVKLGDGVEFSNCVMLIDGKTIAQLINEGIANSAKLLPLKLDGAVKVNQNQNWDGETAEAKSIEIAKMIIKSFENEVKNETPPKVRR